MAIKAGKEIFFVKSIYFLIFTAVNVNCSGLRKIISILLFVLPLALLPFLSSEDNAVRGGASVSADVLEQSCGGGCNGIGGLTFSDYDNRYAELLAVDASQIGSLAANLRLMVKLASKQIYQTSVYWAKDAVRRIAEYIQHKSFISENLNSSKFRVGMAGKHVEYIYQLCRIVI